VGPNPFQPRSRFDDAALRELAASIKASGVEKAVLMFEIVHACEEDEKKVVVWLDHRGVGMSADARDPFHGSTQRCVGVLANFDGAVTANGPAAQAAKKARP